MPGSDLPPDAPLPLPLPHDDTGVPADGAGARTLVLLHGIANSRASFHDLAPLLARRHRVVRVDLRGHGEAPRAGRYETADYAADVIALLDHLRIADRAADRAAERAVLVGHSLGGLTAAWIATRRPERVGALVLLDPPLFTAGPADAATAPYPALFARRRDDAVRWHATGATVDMVAAELGAEGSALGGTVADHLPPDRLRRLAAARLAADPAVFGPTLVGRLAPDWDPDAVRLDCPTLVLCADPALGAAVTPAHRDRLARLAPGADVRTLDGTTHMLHVEAPDRVAAEVLGWLDRLPPVSG